MYFPRVEGGVVEGGVVEGGVVKEGVVEFLLLYVFEEGHLV